MSGVAGSYQLSSAYYKRFFTGNIGEVIGFDRTLSDDERQQLDSQLSRKWGIALHTDAPSVSLPPPAWMQYYGSGGATVFEAVAANLNARLQKYEEDCDFDMMTRIQEQLDDLRSLLEDAAARQEELKVEMRACAKARDAEKGKAAKAELAELDVCRRTLLVGDSVRSSISVRNELDVLENLRRLRLQVDTHFLMAAKNGCLEEVQFCIAKKKNLECRWTGNWQNGRGNTPLIMAAGSGHKAIVDALIQAGANVNARSREGNQQGPQKPFPENKGSSVLHLACGGGHKAIVDTLIHAGAELNYHCGVGCAGGGNTPLHSAAGRGCPECVDTLIQAGADAKQKGYGGCTPTWICSGSSCSPEDKERCMELLRAAGA